MSNTYTITVPHALAEAVEKYCRLKNYKDNGLEILSKLTYGTSRNPSVTAFVLYSASEDTINQAVIDLTKIITDYNNRPIYSSKEFTFWQKIAYWLVNKHTNSH